MTADRLDVATACTSPACEVEHDHSNDRPGPDYYERDGRPVPVGPMATPANATTGAPYKGGNVVRLLTAEAEHDYRAPADLPGGWAGYRQWLQAGRQVRKGEHGTACMTVVTVPDRAGTGLKKVPRGFRVFHYDQTEPAGVVGPAAMLAEPDA